MESNCETRLATWLRAHHGVVTRQELLALGWTKRKVDNRIARGLLLKLAPGVYRSAAAPETWHALLLTACRLGGTSAVTSHRSAAALHGFDGYSEGPLEITVSRNVDRDPPGATVHRPRTTVLDRDRMIVDGIPVTTPERTIVDLARTFSLRWAEDAFDGAAREQTVESRIVAGIAEDLRGRGRTRVGKFSDLAHTHVGVSQPTTKLERAFLRVLDLAYVERPDCQVAVFPGHTVDFAYRDRRIAIEVDGRRGHVSERDRQRDAERDTRLELAGWTVFRFTNKDIYERKEWTASRVDKALQLTLHELVAAKPPER